MNKEIWLWLLLVMGAHNVKTLQIVEHYGDVRTAAEAIRDGICELLDADEKKRAESVRSRDVSAVLSMCEANGIRVITIEDEEYPARLKTIFNPPILLFVQGSLAELDNEPVIAVVGTRKASSYGLRTAKRICTELVRNGMVIVSGLAVGHDTTAHRCALSNGGRTIGVLACGNLVDYPSASRELKCEMIRKGGAVISELPPETGVTKEYFRYRNRIISGLAQGTFITEAPDPSGCQRTAEHAIEQGRELFCIPPHDIFDQRYAGVISFLRDGATPVFSHTDILDAYNFGIVGD